MNFTVDLRNLLTTQPPKLMFIFCFRQQKVEQATHASEEEEEEAPPPVATRPDKTKSIVSPLPTCSNTHPSLSIFRMRERVQDKKYSCQFKKPCNKLGKLIKIPVCTLLIHDFLLSKQFREVLGYCHI